MHWLLSYVFCRSLDHPVDCPNQAGGGIFCECVRRFYIRSSRQLRKILSAAQTPLFSACEELQDGLVIIRAFSQQQCLIHRASQRITCSVVPYLVLQASRTWYSLILGFSSLCFSMVLLPLAIVNRRSTDQGSLSLGKRLAAGYRLQLIVNEAILQLIMLPCEPADV